MAWDAVSLVIGVVGLVLAVIFFLQSRERAKPCLQAGGLSLVEASSSVEGELEIRYAGRPVPRVTSTTLVFWNGGSATLDGSALVESDPLRVTAPDGTAFLQATITARTREVNAVAVELGPAPQEARLTFDYLDPGDGVALKVIHTAPHWSAVTIVGTLKGIRTGVKHLGNLTPPSRLNKRRNPRLWRTRHVADMVANVAFILFGVGTTALGLANLAPGEFSLPTFIRVVFVAGGLAYVSIGGYYIGKERRRYPRALQADGGSMS